MSTKEVLGCGATATTLFPNSTHEGGTLLHRRTAGTTFIRSLFPDLTGWSQFPQIFKQLMRTTIIRAQLYREDFAKESLA
jgi:hypothetical protein